MEIAPVYGDQYEQALATIAKWFRNVGRKAVGGGEAKVPYLSHLLAASALVWEDGGNEDQAIAALAHDAVEDLEWVDHNVIVATFGEEVGRIVALCSDAVNPANKSPWRGRKERHIAVLRNDGDAAALRVVAADKVHNLEGTLALDPNSIEWGAMKGGYGGTRWYGEQMLAVATEKLPAGSVVLGRLRRAVNQFAGLYEPDAPTVARYWKHLAEIEFAGDADYEPDARELERRLRERPSAASVRLFLQQWYGAECAESHTKQVVAALLGAEVGK